MSYGVEQTEMADMARIDKLQDEIDRLRNQFAALIRSMQQIANLDPSDFNSANKAASMAKTALLINRK